MSSSIPSRASTPNRCPVEMSAQSLHELAVQAFRVGNRGRLSLCEALRVLSETRLYLDLGFPSLAAYADAFLQLRRAETFEYVRVSKQLVELTELREAFGQGRMGWSALKAISRVATLASQATWIEFARASGVERTLAEARDALRRGRNAPRDSSCGLPNLDQRLVLRFSRSDMERVRRWIESACEMIAGSAEANEVTLEQALLFLCARDSTSSAEGPHRDQLVYQRCPDCSRARVGTQDGFVEVSDEELERIEGCAEPIVIDGPTPPRLRRQVLARDGSRCGNPRCHHAANHCHHIVFRSKGGKTRLANEVAVCAICHAMIHAGLLRVSGRAAGELIWMPTATDASLSRANQFDGEDADRLPVLRLTACSAVEESAIADSEGRTDRIIDRDDCALGLMRLGVSAPRARQVIDEVIRTLPMDAATEENVLRRAIASL